MCRFLIVKSKEKKEPKPFLQNFAKMAEKSRTKEGDWQGDGCGIAVQVPNSLPAQAGKFQIPNKWEIFKSLQPIWKEGESLSQLPRTNLFTVHARSASFPQHKGKISFSQPFVKDNLCFVFNGVIFGVKLNRKVSGEIGSQKIWTLLQEFLIQEKNEKEALEKLYQYIKTHTRKIRGFNIGLVSNGKIFALTAFEEDPDYFNMYYYKSSDLQMVCSEPIGQWQWKKMEKEKVYAF